MAEYCGAMQTVSLYWGGVACTAFGRLPLKNFMMMSPMENPGWPDDYVSSLSTGMMVT